MTIKSNGGVFGRNPTFNNVEISGSLTGISNLSISGNLIVASGKGIDFSATAGTGTSELFSDYEEGTWTPTFTDWTTAPTTVYNATYTKVGRQVTVTIYALGGITNYSSIGGLPFTSASNSAGAGLINSSNLYAIKSGCGVFPSATALNGIEAGNMSTAYWQLCATYFA